MHPALTPANGQQLISRVMTRNTSTPPQRDWLSSLLSGCSAASRAFGWGVCWAHGGLAGCEKQALAQSHSQALLPELMNFSYGTLRSHWLSQAPPKLSPTSLETTHPMQAGHWGSLRSPRRDGHFSPTLHLHKHTR